MNNKIYAFNQNGWHSYSHNDAVTFCYNNSFSIATMDANYKEEFVRVIINCSLPLPAAQYWISDTTPSTTCWKLSLNISMHGLTSASVETSSCEDMLEHVLCEVPSNLTSSSTISSPTANSTPAHMLRTENLLPSFTTSNQLSVSSMTPLTDLQHSTYFYHTPLTIAGTAYTPFSLMTGESEQSPKVSLWTETAGSFDDVTSTKSSLDLQQSTKADTPTTMISTLTEKPDSSFGSTESHQVIASSSNVTYTPAMNTGIPVTGFLPEYTYSSEWRQLDTHEYIVNTAALPLDVARAFCRNFSDASVLSCPSVTRCIGIANRLNLISGEYWSAGPLDDPSAGGVVIRWPEMSFRMVARNTSRYTICSRMANSTLEIVKANLTRMLNDMTVAPNKTAKALSKLSSAEDNRVSAQNVGAFGVAFICFIVMMLVAVDAINLVRWFQQGRTPA
ncbi:uncharacterized protein LOC127858896 [Dreissena polymorpha]|uniref:uncharacterized protein LOC127858896 n=1 Tax=Dreissena polymorpha TaxID=45954 RepID=UPI00226445D3|nr:uncharacterized protein LOC127858896 [Dreissena polymorpha]XP_052252186.1 uncharacterized protein LOC127858896 [Dreissena polymorpha]XP_052252187.1 uncharacterized protein LOC127858896 [Dreissena polymorpha]